MRAAVFIDPGMDGLVVDLDGDELEAVEGDEDDGPLWNADRGWPDDLEEDEEE